MEKCYSSDLSDGEWECLKLHVPAPNKRGRPRTHSTREILNAVFYVLKSGCPWRLLPRDFPPWETVYWWFGRWRADGTFEHLNAELRGCLRSRLGRDLSPSAGIADSQTTKTTGVGGKQRGYDGNKKVRGRKRHLLVDTEGLVLKAKVHSAKVPDQDGLRLLLESARSGLSRLKHLWLDAGYVVAHASGDNLAAARAGLLVWMDAEEASAYINYPRATFDTLAGRGEIPRHKRGAGYRYKREELDEWLLIA